jgi:hypothetical protein
MAVLALVGLVLVPTAFFEAASQLPGGRASPIQLPLLTTPAVVNLTARNREMVLRGEVSAQERARLAALGAARLASEPLDPTALWLVSLRQEAAEARRTLELADQVSRRERIVQLELTRIKALAGDLPASLVHLDHALTVSPKAAPQILRNVATGLNQPRLVQLFKPYEQRPWYGELLLQAVAAGPQAENAAELMLQGDLGPADIAPNLLPGALSRLVQAGNLETARALADRFAGVDRKAIEQFGPTPNNVTEQALPLTWRLTNDNNVLSELTGGGVAIEVERGLGGTVLSRVTGYDPGGYTLFQDIQGSSEDVRLTWKLACIVDGQFRDIWSQRIPVFARKQTFQVAVNIPANCRVQKWDLVASNQSGSERGIVDMSALRLVR